MILPLMEVSMKSGEGQFDDEVLHAHEIQVGIIDVIKE